ncbi:MAG: transposase [Oscillochloridaceae bacterium umkhey_bin13]
MVTKDGANWKGRVVCFATPERQVTGTLLAQWVAPYKDPWLILTDLAPEDADVTWYGLRAWIECGYKDMKRGGWHWEQTKMTNPARAERLWLALAVATLLVVSVGVHAEVTRRCRCRTNWCPNPGQHSRLPIWMFLP